jgi:hypothetical protein
MHTYNKDGIGRFYSTPKGDYPSVTTVLGAYGDNSWLQEWRDRIDAENADRIVKESTDIGSHLHYLFECLLRKVDAKKSDTKNVLYYVMDNKQLFHHQYILQEDYMNGLMNTVRGILIALWHLNG